MITIQKENPINPKIVSFLNDHLQDMRSVSPPESKHALSAQQLAQDDVIFWIAWLEKNIVGCAALKKLAVDHAEIKAMRVASSYRGQGIASQLIQHILIESEKLNYQCLNLETGSMDFFQPARQLYEKFGFSYCRPFANYKEDPNSIFMVKYLS